MSTELILSGIDVSEYQGSIDWGQVAAAGVNFAFIKATEGANSKDPLFASNWQAAKTAGVIRGAYHFFRPKKPISDQVENFLQAVKSLDGTDLPPVLDLEVPNDWTAIPQAQRASIAKEWLDQVCSRLDRKPIVYLNPSFVTEVLIDATPLSAYSLWIAQYTNRPTPSVPSPWATWTFWQYSNTGQMKGISGEIDLDRFNGTLADLNDMINKSKCGLDSTK